MESSLDRFSGHAYAPGAEPSPATPWADFLMQFDGFFFLFCTVGLLFVVLSQYARQRRRQKNLDKMRAYWEVQRRAGQPDIGTNPRLRYNVGFWGTGE